MPEKIKIPLSISNRCLYPGPSNELDPDGAEALIARFGERANFPIITEFGVG